MRFKVSETHSVRKHVRRDDRQDGRVTTFVLAAVALVAVGALIFAFMKVVGPDGPEVAGRESGDSSGAANQATGASGGGGGVQGDRANGSGVNSAADRTTLGQRVDALAAGSAGAGEGVFGPDGRLLRDRAPGEDIGRDAPKDAGKGGVGGTGYGGGAKSVLGNYAPPPRKPPAEVPPDMKLGEPDIRGHDLPEAFARDAGIPNGFKITSIDGQAATTKTGIQTILGNLDAQQNPPETVAVGLWNPKTGQQTMIAVPRLDLMDSAQ